MRILILSHEGDALGLAEKMSAEGHEIYLFIKDPAHQRSGEGIVERVESWRPYIGEVDFIICDNQEFGFHEKVLQGSGVPIFSCSLATYGLGKSLRAQYELAGKLKWQTPLPTVFKGPRDSIKDLAHMDGGIFLKRDVSMELPNRQVAEQFLIRTTEGSLAIQPKIDGQQVRLCQWWNGSTWVKQGYLSFDEYGLTNTGLLCPTNRPAGSVVVPVPPNSHILDSLAAMKPFLAATTYRGPVSVNTIASGTGLKILSIRCGMHFDSTDALFDGIPGEILAETMFSCANGDLEELPLGSDPLVAIRVSTPPWPFAEATGEFLGAKVLGLTDEVRRHLSFRGLYKAEDDDSIRLSAGDGVVLKASANGQDIKWAAKRAYKTIQGLQIPFKQYRSDIGTRAQIAMDKLTEWNLL